MYIAMNRFRIVIGREEEFEQIWRERDSHIAGTPGFHEFHLLRGQSQDDATLYASHTVWDNEQSFVDWTNSESFRQAHASARPPEGLHLSHPQFEGFEIVL